MSFARVPTSTYRLQLRPSFGFAQVAECAAYLASLGVSHVYLSPVLQAAPGSTHGYDVVDHTRISAELGGRAGFEAMAATLRAHGLGIILDVVPNHMAIPAPAHLNAPLWGLLKDGTTSRYAAWFDVDWEAAAGTILMPVLATPLEQALTDGEIRLDRRGGAGADEWVVRYREHELPVRPGTEALPLEPLLAAQWWRLAPWQAGDLGLNYRRFFDVNTLVAVRVEDPEVFAVTHALVLDLVAAGLVDGLRVDHPDGLADPRGYLRRLRRALDAAVARATGDPAARGWLVVEKILVGQERLPADWPVDGTTGYDTLGRVGGVFVDPRGEGPLLALHAGRTGETRSADEVALEAKLQIGLRVQAAEVGRLVRLLSVVCAATGDVPNERPERLRRAVSALLVSMDRYRAYVHVGEPLAPDSAAALADATAKARRLLPASDHEALDLVAGLVTGQVADRGDEPADPAVQAARRELVVRFQQTCGPIQAKGIEDTAFYRWAPLAGLNEVGSHPGEFATAPEELASFAAYLLAVWPATMTTLTTHDTKRSEDTRAALAVLSELPDEWRVWLRRADELARRARRAGGAAGVDPTTDYLLWQTLVATFPITTDRLLPYAVKAVREAARHTTWVAPDGAFEQALAGAVAALVQSPEIAAHVTSWQARTAPHVRATTLGQKLIQLMHPGIPDIYQGTELVTRTLVDPDNRAPVDLADRITRLARLDEGLPPADVSDEKLLVTSRALRLRRAHPEWFGAGSVAQQVPVTTRHAFALGRGATRVESVAVVTRLVEGLTSAGGRGEQRLAVPEGRWRDLLTEVAHDTGPSGARLRDVLALLPVALLVRER